KGDAFTLVSPEEEPDLRAIERRIGNALPRVILPGFDYEKKSQERLEIPPKERFAAHRARKHGDAKRTFHSHVGAPAPRGARKPRSGQRRRAPGGLDAPAQAILDRHAPVGAGPATRRSRRRR